MPLVLIHTGIVKYLWQILILYSIQFAYPTYSRSPFSDEIAIMIRHYVIHPYLKIRHYVIHPTILIIFFNLQFKYSVSDCINFQVMLFSQLQSGKYAKCDFHFAFQKKSLSVTQFRGDVNADQSEEQIVIDAAFALPVQGNVPGNICHKGDLSQRQNQFFNEYSHVIK